MSMSSAGTSTSPGNGPASAHQPQSLAAKIHHFNKGNTAVLDSPEVVEAVSDYLLKLYHDGDMQHSLLFLEKLGEDALSSSVAHRERSLMALSLVAGKVLEERNEDLLEAIARMLTRWLKHETLYIAGFEYLCRHLGNLLKAMLDCGLWYQTEDLLAVLQEINKGNLSKDRLIRQVISRTQRSIADQSFIETLTHAFVEGKDNKSTVAGNLLLKLGNSTIPHLLDILRQSPDKSERFRLLELIPNAGADATPHLIQGLTGSEPWYFTRNILHIMSKTGDPELLSSIKPFLNNTDIRVQQEALQYLTAMNSADKSTNLLEALNICSKQLKPHVIRALGPLQERRIGRTFIGMLNNITIFDGQLRNDIIQEVCRYLPIYKDQRSLETLGSLLADPSLRRSLTDQTLAAMEKCAISLQKNTNSITKTIGRTRQAHHQQRATAPVDISPEWLERLCEKEALAAPLRKHVNARKELYHRLTHEEFLVFSSLMTHKKYSTNEEITAIGDVHSTLYFIEEGRVAIGFAEDGSHTSATHLKNGDIFGHGIFMEGSEWEVSLTALCTTEVFIFDQEQLLRLQSVYPELCRNILEYCKHRDILMPLHEAACRNRVRYTPEPLPFTGEISDHIAFADIVHLASHGLCFCFILPSGVDHTLFADQRLQLRLQSPADANKTVEARVIGLKFLPDKGRKLCILARLKHQTDPGADTLQAISLQPDSGRRS